MHSTKQQIPGYISIKTLVKIKINRKIHFNKIDICINNGILAISKLTICTIRILNWIKDTQLCIYKLIFL